MHNSMNNIHSFISIFESSYHILETKIDNLLENIQNYFGRICKLMFLFGYFSYSNSMKDRENLMTIPYKEH